VRHDGEEFLYVLTGVITSNTSSSTKPVEMRRGRQRYYDADDGHKRCIDQR